MSVLVCISSIMTDIGATQRLKGVYRRNETTWRVYVEDNREILCCYHAESDKFMMSCGIKLPDVEDKLDIFKSLLAYNTLWKDSDFARFGYFAITETIELARSISVHEIDAEKIAYYLLRLNEEANKWEAVFEECQYQHHAPPPNLDSLSESRELYLKV